jgi:hypothetical protein
LPHFGGSLYMVKRLDVAAGDAITTGFTLRHALIFRVRYFPVHLPEWRSHPTTMGKILATPTQLRILKIRTNTLTI